MDSDQSKIEREKSDLGPSGFTHTNTKGHSWCGEQVSVIRETFDNDLSKASIRLWAYRHDDCEILAVDVSSDDSDKYYSATIMANEGEYEAELVGDDVAVPDMIEAFHLAGIITKSLNLPVTFGLGSNETNDEALSKPRAEGHTNGQIKIFDEV